MLMPKNTRRRTMLLRGTSRGPSKKTSEEWASYPSIPLPDLRHGPTFGFHAPSDNCWDDRARWVGGARSRAGKLAEVGCAGSEAIVHQS